MTNSLQWRTAGVSRLVRIKNQPADAGRSPFYDETAMQNNRNHLSRQPALSSILKEVWSEKRVWVIPANGMDSSEV